MKTNILQALSARRDEEESGFTLIEILVVIIIIGILAAVAIPIFLNQQKTARDSATVQDVRNVATNIETLRVSSPEATDYAISAAEDAQTGTLTLGGSTIDISKTEGTVLGVSANADGGFTVTGYNENGREYTLTSDTAANAATYNSSEGGMVAPTSVTVE